MLKTAELKTARPETFVSQHLPGRHGWAWLAVAASLFGGHLASGQTSVLVSTNYYTVTGNSVPELWQSMVAARPWTNFAYNARTEWETGYRYTARAPGRQWSFQSLWVVTRVTVFLPRWTPPPGADPALVESWAQFQKGLALHELGHISVARAATKELHRQLSTIAAQDSYQALQDEASRAAARTLDVYRRMDAEYDQQTHHGVTQGAVFPALPGRRGPPYWMVRRF